MLVFSTLKEKNFFNQKNIALVFGCIQHYNIIVLILTFHVIKEWGLICQRII